MNNTEYLIICSSTDTTLHYIRVYLGLQTNIGTDDAATFWLVGGRIKRLSKKAFPDDALLYNAWKIKLKIILDHNKIIEQIRDKIQFDYKVTIRNIWTRHLVY